MLRRGFQLLSGGAENDDVHSPIGGAAGGSRIFSNWTELTITDCRQALGRNGGIRN
jgi:hypothetical protein